MAAEAFGLAAGILQVASFGAKLGSKLWTCALKIKHANRELKSLARQVEATAKCLDSIGTLLNDPETEDFHTPKLYEDTQAVSQGFNDIFRELEQAVKKLEGDSVRMTVTARLKWPLDGNKSAEPLRVLRNYNDVLHLMLAVLQIVEGRRAATSEELRKLGESLKRLTISNEFLTTSNKTLVDMLYSQKQSHNGSPDSAITTAASSMSPRSRDANSASVSSFIILPALSNSPRIGPVKPPKPAHLSSGVSVLTQEHLQRCMDSVQELAKTIEIAMRVWRGQEKSGSSDIHGSHARLSAEFGKLPVELESRRCSGRVPWAHFDLVKAASTQLGTCTCAKQTSPLLWRPCATAVTITTPATVQNAVAETSGLVKAYSRSEAESAENLSAVQALFDRWLGDNAKKVFSHTVE